MNEEEIYQKIHQANHTVPSFRYATKKKKSWKRWLLFSSPVVMIFFIIIAGIFLDNQKNMCNSSTANQPSTSSSLSANASTSGESTSSSDTSGSSTITIIF